MDDPIHELLLRLAWAHERSGEVAESRERFEQGAVAARAADLAPALARAALGYAKWQQYGTIDHPAIGLLEDALSDEQSSEPGPDAARLTG